MHATNIKLGDPPDQDTLARPAAAQKTLAEFDRVGKPDNAAKLIADSAAAFFNIDDEVHKILERMRVLHKEIKREVAQKILRCQGLVLRPANTPSSGSMRVLWRSASEATRRLLR